MAQLEEAATSKVVNCVSSILTRSTKFILAPVAQLVVGGCLKNSLCEGSTPSRSTNGVWRNLVARQLWELKVAGSNPAIPMCLCDVIGNRCSFRPSILQVRVLPGVLGS